MADETIPATTARKICGKLYSAATMLHGVQILAERAEDENDLEALRSVAPAVMERARLILDACIRKIEGGGGIGNPNDNDWDEENESAVDHSEGGA